MTGANTMKYRPPTRPPKKARLPIDAPRMNRRIWDRKMMATPTSRMPRTLGAALSPRRAPSTVARPGLVSEPIGLAPTQELGAALYDIPELEGFRTVSSKVPYAMNLVVFPQKLQPGSRVEFAHPTLGTHAISGPTPVP